MARPRMAARRAERMSRQWVSVVSRPWGSTKTAVNGQDAYGYTAQLVPLTAGYLEGVTSTVFAIDRDMTVLATYGAFHDVPASPTGITWLGGGIGFMSAVYSTTIVPKYGLSISPGNFFAACPMEAGQQPGGPWNVIESKGKRKVRAGNEIFVAATTIGANAVTLGDFSFTGRILLGYR